jgi:flagellar biosynthesis protein FlhF
MLTPIDRDDAAPPAFRLVDRDLEPGQGPDRWPEEGEARLRAVLRLHAVPDPLCQRLLELALARLPEDPGAALAHALERCLKLAPLPAADRPAACILVGPPGAGRSTLAAKLAARHRGAVVLLNADTARAGAARQLADWAAVLGAPVETVAAPAAAAACVEAADGALTIIDTPGTGPYDADGMARLAALAAATRATPILVLPAGLDAGEALAAMTRFRAIGATSLVLTRLDMVRRLGPTLGAAAASGLPLAGGSITGHFAYGLRPLTAPALAERLIAAAPAR